MYLSQYFELGIMQAKTGYKFTPPSTKRNKVYYLEVIEPLRWEMSESRIDPSLIPVGSVTWSYNYVEEGAIHPEDNKLCANVDAKCFRLIKVEAYSEDAPQMTDTSLYRFKTKEEFIKEGRWVYAKSSGRDVDCPARWASDGGMNKYLGQLVSPHGHEAIKLAKDRDTPETILLDGFYFRESDFIGKDVIPPHVGIHSRMYEVYSENPKPVEQVNCGEVEVEPSIVPTFRHPDYISHGTTNKNSTDDIVIESTINITI
jgi:hypothetical protein